MFKKAVEVTVSHLESIIDRYIDAGTGLNYALKIVGSPGVGKSAIVQQAAKRKNFYFIDTRLAFKENVDLGGYPIPDHDTRRMIYYRPAFIPPENVPEGYDGVLWFLDEVNRAHPTVIQTLFQIITEGRCGEHDLPPGTVVVLAGNLGEGDNTVITDFDDAALDGRLALVHLKPGVNDWLNWASSRDIHPSITRYITLFPESLWKEEETLPNPRAWHQVSQALKLSYQLHDERALVEYLSHDGQSLKKVISSLVGETSGSEFVNHLLRPRKISTEEILSGNMERLTALEEGEVPAEDIFRALSGSLDYLKDAAAKNRGTLSSKELKEFSSVLVFLSAIRADTRSSFFNRLIRQCGIFTQIPDALKLMEDVQRRETVTAFFDEFLKPDNE